MSLLEDETQVVKIIRSLRTTERIVKRLVAEDLYYRIKQETKYMCVGDGPDHGKREKNTHKVMSIEKEPVYEMAVRPELKRDPSETNQGMPFDANDSQR